MPHIDILQIGLAFIEGFGLILSPCILPILPIMLAASLDGGKARPLGIITGFIAAFTVSALLLRQLLEWLHVDTEIVRNVALVFLMFFGFVMLSKKLSDKLLAGTQGLANLGQNLSSGWDQNQSFLGGVGIGALIGLIWTPCAGPILAAAVVQIIQAKNTIEAALTTTMFALGAGIPMLIIALTGRTIMSRLRFAKQHSYAIRRVLGLIIIAAAVLIYSGADVALLAGSGGAPTPQTQPQANVENKTGLIHALEKPYPAPEIAGVTEWVNTTPLKITDLKGKVVLVDFWTYSCINCVRTLPYITAWDAKYRDKGLVIIGVHSPEFEFEKKLDNVKAATVKFGIHYPVALDSTLQTWSAFNNHYWPAHYLINKDGQVVYTHFGEGDYDVTEQNIRTLLGVNDTTITETKAGDKPASATLTQETYLGFTRAKNFDSPEAAGQNTVKSYSFPPSLAMNHWALNGNWSIQAENITATQMGVSLRLNFQAKKVFLVLGTADNKPITVHILLNGKPVTAGQGADVKNGALVVDSERLYELIDQSEVKKGLLELQSETPNLQAYAFTFGG